MTSREGSEKPPVFYSSSNPGDALAPGDGATRSSRRSNPKVRTGCRTCKKRKIKCDENKPSCRNCTKHAVTCDYIHDTHPGTTPNAALPSSLGGGLNFRGDGPSPSSSHPSQSPLPATDTPEDEDGGVNLADLELMHTFTTSTCHTLSSNAAVGEAFQTAGVGIALKWEFVMRALLAVTACHVAHSRGRRGRDRSAREGRAGEEKEKYLARAARDFEAACGMVEGLMTVIREDKWSGLERITTAELEAFYMFLLFTTYYGISISPRSEEDHILIGASSQPYWSGYLDVLMGVHDELGGRNDNSWALQPLMDDIESHPRREPFTSASNPNFLLELEDCVLKASASIDYSKTTQRVSHTLFRVIEHLRLVLAPLYDELPPSHVTSGSGCDQQSSRLGRHGPEPMDTDGPRTSTSQPRSNSSRTAAAADLPPARNLNEGDVFQFLFRFAGGFLSLLHGPTSEIPQEVLCIFAHFLIVVKKAEGSWWMDGWAVELMERVWAALDQKHRLYVRWPVEEVGWVPSS